MFSAGTIDRRIFIKSGAMGVGLVSLGLTGANALEHDNSADLPKGLKRGAVVDYAEGVPIYDVLDEHGVSKGVTFGSADLPRIHGDLKRLGNELEGNKISPNGHQVSRPGSTTQGAGEVAACAAALAWFIGSTVFPWARGAKLALRLAKLVKKYGANTVARIIKGARGIAGSTVENDIKNLALELSGIAGLKACKPS